jgi:hypothetical protein
MRFMHSATAETRVRTLAVIERGSITEIAARDRQSIGNDGDGRKKYYEIRRTFFEVLSSSCANPISEQQGSGRIIDDQSLPSIVINTKHQSSDVFQATDTVYSDRMQDIRGVQASLYSYAVPYG